MMICDNCMAGLAKAHEARPHFDVLGGNVRWRPGVCGCCRREAKHGCVARSDLDRFAGKNVEFVPAKP